MQVLVVGSGGREHALCWALSASPLLTRLWCAPGNPGIAQVAECAKVDLAADTTLKPGDVVATKAGMTVVEGGRNKQAELAPVSSANIGKSERAALSQLRVMQDYGAPRGEVTGSVTAPKDQKSAELKKGR